MLRPKCCHPYYPPRTPHSRRTFHPSIYNLNNIFILHLSLVYFFQYILLYVHIHTLRHLSFNFLTYYPTSRRIIMTIFDLPLESLSRITYAQSFIYDIIFLQHSKLPCRRRPLPLSSIQYKDLIHPSKAPICFILKTDSINIHVCVGPGSSAAKAKQKQKENNKNQMTNLALIDRLTFALP